MLLDHRADVLAWNPLGHALLAGHLDPHAPEQRHRPNIARMLFLDPQQHIGQLTARSREFARMWARKPVRTCSHYVRELDHPVVGRVTLANETVSLPDDDQQLGLFYARPGTADADALTLLARETTR
ncbi:hypothetical protein [Lentzea guizhouensis]|uniref:MmyB family transcriptional regulator n=1 Tax=Lentzea guizhouensis TaxID=1586287 RepID=UPI000AA566C2|nr:hypothetical protein [Lentzea guizhouensis]